MDQLLASFKREAADVFGPNVEVVTLRDAGWLGGLAWLAQREGARTWVPQLEIENDKSSPNGWRGLLELWPETSHHVLVRREEFLGIFSDLSAHTMIAARTRADIDRAIDHGRTLWRDWRRTTARIHDARGRTLRVAPTSWDQLYLPSALLDDVRASVLHFAGARDTYQELALPFRRGLLFYGPPGNGKTMLCRAIITALQWPVVYVSPHTQSETGSEIQSAFAEAEELAPCVLWFDDIDSIFETDATTSSFLNRLDGASSSEGLFVLATTNQPEKLDPAIVSRPSRFDRVFEVPPPAARERDRYLAQRPGARIEAAVREELVRRTAGMSMAFVQEVVVGATLRSVQRGEPPNATDYLEVLGALSRHLRAADRGFETSQPTGFTAR